MTYTPRTQPRAHQAEALRRVAGRPSRPSDADAFAWLMDMGTGKTWVVLAEWGARVAAGDLSDLLVIAPAGAYRNWDLDRSPEEPGEMTKHLCPALRERMVSGAWVSGGGVGWKASMGKLLAERERPRALVVNVEALSSVQAARDACSEFLAQGRAMMVVDESTRVKSHRAERTKQVQLLGQAARARRIASGLVSPRSPMDLWSQFGFLDWRILGFRSFYGFRAHYAIVQRVDFGGRRVEVEVGYRNISQLQASIAPYSYRVLKEECLDLEPKVYTTRDVPLTDEQRRLYRELRDYATAELRAGTHITATAVITQILRLQQMLQGHVVDEQGLTHDIEERRTDALLEVLEEHEGKAIIWVSYDRTLRKIAARLEKAFGEGAVARFWGGNAATRSEDELRFKSDPACRFMVSTPAAGGIGNTWVAADLVVYFANTYDLELRSQSEDRAHRIGQTKPVTYVDLVSRGTVDEKILVALRRKINMATSITGENYREWLI